jgi:hypothetical protein
MRTNREVAELRRQARRLREIGMIETDVARDLAEVIASLDRQADALEAPVVGESTRNTRPSGT